VHLHKGSSRLGGLVDVDRRSKIEAREVARARQVEPGDFLDPPQAIGKRVPVHVKGSAGCGAVEVSPQERVERTAELGVLRLGERREDGSAKPRRHGRRAKDEDLQQVVLGPEDAPQPQPARVLGQQGQVGPCVRELGPRQWLGDRKDEMMKPYLSTLPLKRLGRPEELAHAVLFLMTNGYTTGTVLHVDGGSLLI